MKYVMLGCLLACACIAYAGEPDKNNYVVSVPTEGATAINRNAARKTLRIINTARIAPSNNGWNTVDYCVWLATFAVSSGTYKTKGAYPIMPNGGEYVDNYNVYLDTWYVCAVSTYPITIAIQESE